jgi:tellurite resistance protein
MDAFVPPKEAIAILKSSSEAQLIAALELMYLVAKADGFVAADELRQLLAVAKASDHNRVDSRKLSALIGEWKARGRLEPEPRIKALGSILETPEVKRAAYELAAATVVADRGLSSGELQVVNLISDTFGLT